MNDITETFALPEDMFENIIDDNGTEGDLEEEYPLIAEYQAKYNRVNERFISLKAIIETLKSQLEKEKQLWKQELEETIKMEKQFKEQQKKHYEMLIPEESEMKRKYELFRDFLFFSQATENIEKLAKQNNYQQWLSEVESECSLELDRIQRSLTALKPLRELAAKWKDGIFSAEIGADGDKDTAGDSKENEETLFALKETV